MRYYKTVADGFIIMVGTGNGGTEIIENKHLTTAHVEEEE